MSSFCLNNLLQMLRNCIYSGMHDLHGGSCPMHRPGPLHEKILLIEIEKEGLLSLYTKFQVGRLKHCWGNGLRMWQLDYDLHGPWSTWHKNLLTFAQLCIKFLDILHIYSLILPLTLSDAGGLLRPPQMKNRSHFHIFMSNHLIFGDFLPTHIWHLLVPFAFPYVT